MAPHSIEADRFLAARRHRKGWHNMAASRHYLEVRMCKKSSFCANSRWLLQRCRSRKDYVEKRKKPLFPMRGGERYFRQAGSIQPTKSAGSLMFVDRVSNPNLG